MFEELELCLRDVEGVIPVHRLISMFLLLAAPLGRPLNAELNIPAVPSFPAFLANLHLLSVHRDYLLQVQTLPMVLLLHLFICLYSRPQNVINLNLGDLGLMI
jgi:hypothetical protein